MKQAYDVIMDDQKNPLNALPKAQRFQIMVFLSVMWTTIFCVAIGSWVWWDALVIGHVAIACGLLITGATFKAASARTHRDLYRAKDGTVRYDDIWGG